MSVSAGTLLGDRYRIERKLARGGMGEVWVATDTRFNAPVAVKIATPPAEGRAEFKTRFRREAVIGRLLGSRSTGFVRALDWGELKAGSLYLVMDLVEGAKPFELVLGPRPERIRRLLTAARLVQEVHALGIVHRDLKPGNFFLGADGTVRLGDFGLAKLADDAEENDPALAASASQTGIAMGTPFFMAPEQVDAKHVDQRADVYPLGVMLFQALTERLPYAGSLPAMLARQQRVLKGNEPPPRPRQHDETIPAELDALCLEALQPDPARRLRSAVAFADRLEAWLQKNGTASPRPAPAASKASPSAGPTSAAPPPPPSGLAPVPGQEGVYRHERDDSLLVWIPPGFFYPGARDDDPGKTLTQVAVPGFYLGKFPVTWRQFVRFCKATGRETPRSRFPAGDDHPVHGVSWNDAHAYCAWAGLRLPSEEEWEYAARGEDPRRYPWGDDAPTASHMNWAGHPEHKGKRTSPVGSCPRGASPFGVLDMCGNVQEWQAGEDEGPSRARPVRGGAYSSGAEACRPDERALYPDEAREPSIGFRVALSRSEEAAEDAAERARTTRRFSRQGIATAVAKEEARPAPATGRTAPVAARGPRPTAASRPAPPPAARPAPPPAARPAPPPAPRPQPPPQRPAPPPPATPRPVMAPLPPVTAKAERPASGAHRPAPPPAPSDQGQVSTGQRKRVTEAQETLLLHVEALLGSCGGSGISKKGSEIKFTAGDPPVSYSFLAPDAEARWAYLEQRVTFDPAALQGDPTGRANLLLATNLITHYGRGIRCLVTEDRLRFRRELLISPGPEPLLLSELQQSLARLLAAWTDVFGPLRDVQGGVPWHERLAFLLEPRPPRQPTVVQQLELLLDGFETEKQANRIRIAFGELEEPIDLVWADDLSVSLLIRPWGAPLEETLALRQGEHAPTIEALLEELNEKNAVRPYSLSWDPKRGVIARAHLAGEPPPRARIVDAMELLVLASQREAFTTI